MIIVGEKKRWVPYWYAVHCARRARKVLLANPGFERVVFQMRPLPPHDMQHFADPDCEPDVRRILSRAMVLDPPEPDADPYVRL